MTDFSARLSSPHKHVFLGENHQRNERRTWLVIAITATMMVIEITAGSMFGSMALVADGWHMSTHAAAMLIAALAYYYARKNAITGGSPSAPVSWGTWPASPARSCWRSSPC